MLQQIEREPQNSKKKNKLARQRGCQTTEYSVYIEKCFDLDIQGLIQRKVCGIIRKQKLVCLRQKLFQPFK